MSATALSTPASSSAGVATRHRAPLLQQVPSSSLVHSTIARVLRTFKLEFLWVCVFSAVSNVLMLTSTIYMLQLFDRVMPSGNVGTLVAVTLLMLVFTAVQGIAEWLRSRLLVRAGSRFDAILNRSVFDAAFDAQLNAVHRAPTQPLNDLNTLRQFLSGNGIFAVADMPWTMIFIIALFLMHPWLGMLSVVFCVIQVALGFTANRIASRVQRANQELALDGAQFLQAKLRNAETLEAMGMVSNLRSIWLGLTDRSEHHLERSHEIAHRIQAFMKWLQYTQQGLMLSLGALLVIRGQIGAGAMVASNTLMGNALRPVGLITQIWGQFVEARGAFDRLNALLAAHPAKSNQAPDRFKGQVTLRGLTATAPSRERPILQGLDVEFKAGEVVGIVGPSGAGKSTLARCLLGIWPNTEGDVLLDGHSVHEWPRDQLGPQLGYLPQDVELFEGTVAENIARFAELPPEQVIAAAKTAGIHEMVLRQAKGYDTPIGEGGAALSGGQRQRLGLARAIVGSPALVVLDEPSANLDDVGETALIRAVTDLKATGSSVFMIVHQQHLLAVCDRVIVLEAGRITKMATVSKADAPATASNTSLSA